MPAPLPIEISAPDVSVLLDATPRACRIIDCREEDEFQICRLPEAQLVPLSRFGEMARESFNDRDEHLIIYCHHGMRSLRAADWLRSQGFARAQSMQGGIQAWADQVDPETPRY